MPCRRIPAHYEQLSEFEIGCTIGLKEAGWNHADWECIVFSDKIRFQLCPENNRKRVCRRPGQRADPSFTIAHHTGPQPGVMVWGAISFGGQTLWSSLEAQLQHSGTSTNLLRTVFLPFIHCTLALFCCKIMPNHMRHVLLRTVSQLVKHLLDQPDLSPIEHVWDMMGRLLHLPGNVDDLARH
ncbi:transposable element Tc1 transposase [Trichonephila clavipes]|nr:transposable element Tc1 transposase [Trichonephila clavipes]